MASATEAASNPNPIAGKQAAQLASAYADAMKRRDVAKLRELLDAEAIVDRAIKGMPGSAEFKRGVKLGFTRTFHQSLMQQVALLRDYRLLRIRDIEMIDADGAKRMQRRPLFRLLNPNGGLNYHELILKPGPAGKLRVVDIRVMLSGENLSQSIRRQYLFAVVTNKDSSLDGVTAKQRKELEGIKLIPQLLRLVQQRKAGDAKSLYEQMPESVKRDPSVQVNRLQFATAIGKDYFKRASKEFLAWTDSPATLDLLSIDVHLLNKEYDAAVAAIQRLHKHIGGDPHLFALAANVQVEAGQFDEARKLALKAIELEPMGQTPYWSLVTISIHQEQYDETARLLTLIQERLKLKLSDLRESPFYSGFVASEAGKRWLARQQKSRQDEAGARKGDGGQGAGGDSGKKR